MAPMEPADYTPSDLSPEKLAFRLLADSAPVLLWLGESGTRRKWFNAIWLRFVGRTREQEQGAGWAQNVHPDDMGRSLEACAGGPEARRPFSVEYRLKRHDGEYRWMLDQGAPYDDPAGRFAGYVGSCVDISELKQADSDLRESQEVLSLAMRGGRMGAWSRNLETDEVWWNAELEGLFGLAPGTFEGSMTAFRGLVHEDDRAALADAVDAAVRQHTDYVVEFRFRHASGEWRWMDGRGRAVYREDGTPRTLYGIGIDITDHKLAQVKHAYASAIIASSDDAILSKTLAGIITSWNAGAERMFGYTAAEAVGSSIEILVPPDRLEEERAILSRLSRGEPSEHYETVRRTKAGRDFALSLSVSPVKDRSGKVIGASTIARDITERKFIEAERERLLAREQFARTQAEEASRLKDEFLATVSHELRTPLNAILGWARLLGEGRLDADKARYAAEVVERNARTQVQLIDDLLDVSRIITGKLRLSVRPLMPAAEVQAALETLKPMAEAKEITLDSLLDPAAGPIAADSERLHQVIWNLVSNAIKFSARGGHVMVRLHRQGGQAELTVSDTGQGIGPEFLPHVFDRFRQADSSATRTFGGLGLGLAIVRHVVELHGGEVTADSAGPGLGATFTVRLPIAVAQAATGAQDSSASPPPLPRGVPAREAAPNLASVRVLVVDDEPDSRDLLREVLERCGAEVHDVNSARLALLQVQEWRPHVIVSDIGMPDRDGYQLIQDVRRWEEPARRITPAIALTAYARGEDRLKALRAGFQVHVTKPVDPLELALIVSNLAAAPPPPSRGAGEAQG